MESIDGGQTWSMVGAYPQDRLEGGDLTFAPSRLNRIIFQSTINGASISEDGGKTWHPSSGLPKDAWKVVFSPADDEFVWAPGRDNLIYLSVDGGQTFNQTAASTGRRRLSALTPHPSDKNLLYFAEDGTFLATFDRRSSAVTEQKCAPLGKFIEIDAIAVPPGNPSVIYLGLNKRGIIIGLHSEREPAGLL
jgi:photosystem II stability/assembly factor-like uncharacterized protein